MEILPSITTTNSNWRERIKEVKDLSLTTIGFFPTCLTYKNRQEAYQLLIGAGVKNIPFVHLRTDMDVKEINYLIDQFHTKVFNIHTRNAYQLEHDLTSFKDIIYVENQSHKFADDEMEIWAGICIDFSHLENARLKKSPLYDYFVDKIAKYPTGCAHINAIKNKFKSQIIGHYDYHKYNNLSDFDYLRQYKTLIPDISALELENPLIEQIKARDYIEKLISA